MKDPKAALRKKLKKMQEKKAAKNKKTGWPNVAYDPNKKGKRE